MKKHVLHPDNPGANGKKWEGPTQRTSRYINNTRKGFGSRIETECERNQKCDGILIGLGKEWLRNRSLLETE